MKFVKLRILISLILLVIPFHNFAITKTDSLYLHYNNQRNIETNFLWLKLHEFQFSHPKSQVLLSADPASQTIYAAARGLPEISIISKTYSSKDELKLSKIKTVLIPNLDLGLEKAFILDIKFSGSKLYSSVFRYSDKKSCSYVELLEANRDLTDFKSIFKSSPCLSNVSNLNDISGRITTNDSFIFIAGGNMLMDMGNTSFPRSSSEFCCPSNNYRDTMKETNFFGSVISIDKKSHFHKKVSQGHRSPGGLFFDNSRNILWESEHGPRGGDEINQINLHKFKDYGYPFVTFGAPYRNGSGNLDTKFNSHEKFTLPFYAFIPSVGPAQFSLPPPLSKTFNNYWGNDLLLTTLKDRSIFRMRVLHGKVVYSEKVYIGNRLRSIDTIEKYIILGTDNGSIIAIEPSKIKPEGAFPINDYDFPSCAFNGKDKACNIQKKHNWISRIFTS